MRFEIRPPFIVFQDNEPGQNVKMVSSTGEEFPFNSAASLFSDARKSYSWAFDGTVNDGELVTFSTDDRSVVGYVRGGEIIIDESGGPPARTPEELWEMQKPLLIQNQVLPQDLKLSKKRPIAMPRPKAPKKK